MLESLITVATWNDKVFTGQGLSETPASLPSSEGDGTARIESRTGSQPDWKGHSQMNPRSREWFSEWSSGASLVLRRRSNENFRQAAFTTFSWYQVSISRWLRVQLFGLLASCHASGELVCASSCYAP